MNKKQPNLTSIENELRGASSFFPSSGKSEAPQPPQSAPNLATPHKAVSPIIRPSDNIFTEANQDAKKEINPEGSKEVKKFPSLLVNIPSDPPVNKVGYYFTRREIDQLDTLLIKLKPILRDQYNLKISKNEIIRACLALGLVDWEEHQLTSQLVYLLTSK